MMKSLLAISAAVALATGLPSIAAAVEATPQYRLQVAGFFQGADYGLVTGMNNLAQTVFIRHSFGTRSYWYDGVQTVELLPNEPAFSQAVVHDLGDNGVAVGQRLVSGTRHLAMIWEQGVPRDLGTLGGLESLANAINDQGIVAGWSSVPSGAKHLFTWDEGFTDHGPLPPSATCCHDIEAINSGGQVVGHDSGSLLQGWLFDGGQFTNLPDLNGGFDSTPRDVNDAGVAVGASWPRQQNMRPVTWIGGAVQALPLPPSAVSGEGRAINELGEAVGTVIVPDDAVGFLPQAVLWKDGAALLLHDVVTNVGDWHLRNAEHINDRGQILVLGYSPTQFWQRVLLTPVPEPAAAQMLAIGVAAVNCPKRRRIDAQILG